MKDEGPNALFHEILDLQFIISILACNKMIQSLIFSPCKLLLITLKSHKGQALIGNQYAFLYKLSWVYVLDEKQQSLLHILSCDEQVLLNNQHSVFEYSNYILLCKHGGKKSPWIPPTPKKILI